MIARKCDRCGSFYIPKDDMRTYVVGKKSFVNPTNRFMSRMS